MQISEAVGGTPTPGAEPCRFPKLEECAHFHYERVQLPQLLVALQTNMDQSLHSQHGVICEEEAVDWQMVQVTSGDECWLLQRSWENFKMLDEQLHQCIFDRKVSKLPDLRDFNGDPEDLQDVLTSYLSRFSSIADNSLNCGPILNWFQMDNRGHRLLVPSEESRSINTPAVAAAYSVRRYVSQARDELNLEVGDMISVIDMASPGESVWWRGKRGFQVGFFPQHCVHIIGDKVPRNIPLPPPIVGSLALSPIKPVLRKHGKLIAFFRSFILNRPSRRKLKQSGILKERVFGCDLGEHLLNSGHDIPMVLKCCAEFIEEHGIVDGIYRLSGITSNIQKLRNAFDEDRIPNLYTEDILQDIHSVASLLKMYFRELPNPLCTYQLYQSFVGAVQGCNSANRDVESDRERLLKMREAVQKLPPPHYRTLEYLMRHLAKVAAFGARTGMTTRNVAIVWAPNLLRCAELEVGGVAALQGVGIQAVVTEFLICYADLIFCDRLPASLDLPQQQQQVLGRTTSFPSPKRCRPKSLAISTPTKLITLEEARNKHMSGRLGAADECGYIEVGGGPQNLPKKYHTVIELPSGNRKRGLAKRSPLGWRSFFSKNRSNAQAKSRKASTPGIVASDKFVTESDLTDIKRKLRTVKSAESLTSGHSEPAANDSDVLGPLNPTNKPSGHNRSVSHDSYFDTLQTSQNNSEGSLLDLSEIQLNFELEESEMRIFSEDESLVSSPRRVLTRMRPEGGSMNPSPKKQARMLVSPESNSRKRTRLEDQLSDIQFIDCCTPENVVTTTTVVVHQLPEVMKTPSPTYRKSKSPRNSGGDCCESPGYQRLGDSSAGTTSPGFSPEYGNPVEIEYRKLDDKVINSSPAYENVLTTISITYKSPTKSSGESIYEDLNPEKAMIPTVPAELPEQEAMQPEIITFVNDASARSSSSSTPPSPTSPLSSLHLSLSEVVAGDSSCNEPATSVGTPITLSPNVTTPSTPDLVEFASEGEKRKSSEIAGDVVVDGDDEREVYQQVKYFRRSVGEVNALLEEEVCKADEEETCSGDFDSLEVIDANVAVYENVILVDKADEKETAVDVDSLEVVVVENGTHEPTTVDEEAFHPRKVYDKESLPPCLRARNMRNQLKTTRSLDESEFTSVGGESSLTTERRKSMDEGRLKTLNAPKPVPFGVDEVKSVHMAHQSEVSVSEQQRRERIERYKEERRKFLQDKYKSESFKEDKDVLLSRLKVFKMRDETEVEEEEGKTRIPRPTARRKNNDVGSSPPPPLVEVANSIRSRTAMFEMRARKGEDEEEQQQQHVVLRRGERGNRVYNRHTLETGGRERMSSSPPPAERRASLDSCKRRDPVTPTYCIKDMKAIFESKSKQ